MAGADETRRLLRQCASSLLSACHRLERGETESSAAHLQTSNATTPNRTASNSSQTNLNATTPNSPSIIILHHYHNLLTSAFELPQSSPVTAIWKIPQDALQCIVQLFFAKTAIKISH